MELSVPVLWGLMRLQVSAHTQTQVNPDGLPAKSDSSVRRRPRAQSNNFCQQSKQVVQIQQSAYQRRMWASSDWPKDKDRNLRNQAKCHLSAPVWHTVCASSWAVLSHTSQAAQPHFSLPGTADLRLRSFYLLKTGFHSFRSLLLTFRTSMGTCIFW